MQVFANQTFKDFDDRDSGAVFSDMKFDHCHFDGCLLSKTQNPNLRTTIRNIFLSTALIVAVLLALQLSRIVLLKI